MASDLYSVEIVPTLPGRYGYIVMCAATREAAIIDAGAAEPFVERITRMEAKPICLLSTHHHLDHTAGNEELASTYPLKIFGHKNDAERIPGLTDPLEDGGIAAWGSAFGKSDLYAGPHLRQLLFPCFSMRFLRETRCSVVAVIVTSKAILMCSTVPSMNRWERSLRKQRCIPVESGRSGTLNSQRRL